MSSLQKETDQFNGQEHCSDQLKTIFELEASGVSAIDVEDIDGLELHIAGLTARDDIGLPDVPEPSIVRHYTNLSQRNYSIDTNMYPLGSCTMKYNPRLNERVSRFSGFAKLHPLQSEESTQGALELIYTLQKWLLRLTGMHGAAMSPAAGAQGELCGMMAIRAALREKGEEHRKIVLVPDSAHGTNPATAVACGFKTVTLKSDKAGRVDLLDFKEKLEAYCDELAGIMLTNPNTCGVYEKNIKKIADDVHKAGGYFYCDGANFNAIMGQIRPGDLGVDAMHLNLHKTFSTPHGGGGPGAGPVVFSERLMKFAPLPKIIQKQEGHYALIEQAETDSVCGRLKGFHGQFGMFVRAYTYCLSLGIDGIRQASADAVLNANYIKHKLKDIFHVSFEGDSMHEILFDEKSISAFGVTTLDIAKALIDYGFHPMTIYFPLIVKGAMLIEPTETESKENLDRFIAAMEELYKLAHENGTTSFKNRPFTTMHQKLDEARAAKDPILIFK